MKKNKVFGIGAVVLMILLALMPAVYGISLKTNSMPYKYNNLPINKGDTRNEILDIFDRYKTDIDEINQYVEEYIKKNGCIDENFELTDDLQIKFDAILYEIHIEKQNSEKAENINHRDFEQQFSSIRISKLNQVLRAILMTGITNIFISGNVKQNSDKYFLTFETLPGDCKVVINGVGSKKTSCEDDDCSWGDCTFYDLEKGYYTWSVSKNGYKPESGRTYVSSDGKQIVILEEDEGEDGITKLEFYDYRISTIYVVLYLGWELKCWMNHDYIVNNLNPGSAAGIAGMALLLIALGLTSYGVAWIFAAWLINDGVNVINNKDQGRGVYIHCKLTIPYGVIWPPRVSPQ